MNRSNYHTHTRFCDGKGMPRDYAEKALSLGFESLGFSGHAPLPYPTIWTMDRERLASYFKAVRGTKCEYGPRGLEVYLGLEIDWIEGVMGPCDPVYDTYDLDYRIGSVHSLRNPDTGRDLAMDGPDEDFLEALETLAGNDVIRLAKLYYAQVRAMVEAGGFDILGHFDLMKKKNLKYRYLDETLPGYRREVMDTLEVIGASGVLVEVNTGGMARKATADAYPSAWIIEACRDLCIPLVLNSDSHDPETLAFAFPETLELLKSLGIKELWKLGTMGWVPEGA